MLSIARVYQLSDLFLWRYHEILTGRWHYWPGRYADDDCVSGGMAIHERVEIAEGDIGKVNSLHCKECVNSSPRLVSGYSVVSPITWRHPGRGSMHISYSIQ